MAKKQMKSVWIKECKLLEQAVKQNSFGYLTLAEHAIVDKAVEGMRASELYNEIWGKIWAEWERLVNEECIPEWNKISEEMRPLWEERNELDKEKAADKDNFSEEKQKRLDELNVSLSNLMEKYQAVTDAANKKLEEFKENLINENQGGCFFLEDEDYDFVAKFVGW